MKARICLFGAIVIFAFSLGCSGDTGNPASPPVQDTSVAGSALANNTYLWGVWDIVLDPDAGEAEIVPLRDAAFTCNVVKFLQPPSSPVNLITINLDPSSDWPNGYAVIDVTLTHPFPSLPMYTGFDVRAAVFGNGSIQGIADEDILYGGEAGIELLNADGMTRWFNPSEFTSYNTLFGFTQGRLGFLGTNFPATLNPYKYYCDGLGSEDDIVAFFGDYMCPNPRGMFGVASAVTRRFELQFPIVDDKPSFRFQYAVIASWEPPDPNPPVNIPGDFSLSANCDEAYVIGVTDESDMWYTDENHKGGSMKLRVRVFDHQGLHATLSQISAIHIETPGGLITTGGIATFDSGTLATLIVGIDPMSTTFALEVSAVDPPGQGEFPIMVVVESGDPTGYDQGFPGFSYPSGRLAAYMPSTVSIGPGVQGEYPIAMALMVSAPPYCVGDPVEFDASGSVDPNGNIVSYEWDFDGDGVYGDPYDFGTDVNPTKIYTEPGIYLVDLLITDDEGLTDTLDEPLVVEVGGPTWVDDDADPAMADGTFENPWTTIQDGIDNAFEGCIPKWVLVKDGVYEENITLVSDMIVEGASDPPPLLMTAEGSPDPMVNFGSSQNSIFTHFIVQPKCTTDAFEMGGSDNTLEDIEVLDNPGGATCSYLVDAGGWGSVGRTVSDVRCDGYHITSGNPSGFIKMSGGGATVVDCVFVNVEFTNVDTGQGPFVFLIDVGDGDSLYARNVVGNINFSGPDDVHPRIRAWCIEDCPGAVVRNNLVFDFDNNSNGGWTAGILTEDAADMVFEHNTVYGISGPAWIYAFDVDDHDGDPSGVTHRSHIVAHLSAGMMGWRWAYRGSWDDPFELPVDYSCAYEVGNAFDDDIVEGVGFTYGNPMFMNAAGDDYRVSPGSPCSGTAHDGTDMGAYGGIDPLTWLPD